MQLAPITGPSIAAQPLTFAAAPHDPAKSVIAREQLGDAARRADTAIGWYGSLTPGTGVIVMEEAIGLASRAMSNARQEAFSAITSGLQQAIAANREIDKIWTAPNDRTRDAIRAQAREYATAAQDSFETARNLA